MRLGPRRSGRRGFERFIHLVRLSLPTMCEPANATRTDDGVRGEYGECDGEAVFVIVADGNDDAWLATPVGGERSLEATR